MIALIFMPVFFSISTEALADNFNLRNCPTDFSVGRFLIRWQKELWNFCGHMTQRGRAATKKLFQRIDEAQLIVS
jgi:hypothetical protein